MTNNANEPERAISTDTRQGLQLPVYQDPQDVKKMRNRLAQRKHRARAKRPSSQSTSQDFAGAGILGSSSSTGTSRQECNTDVNPAIKATGSIMPSAGESVALQNAKASTNNNADLRQFMMPSLPNLLSYDMANSDGYFPSDDMRVNQDSATFQTRFLPQTYNIGPQNNHDFASLYEATQRQHQFQQLQLQLQAQAAQQLHWDTRPETHVLNSPTHTRHSRAQSLSNTNLGKKAQVEASTTALNVNISGRRNGGNSTSNPNTANNSNKIGSPGSSSGTSSGISSPGNSRHDSPEATPHTTPSKHNLEGRFERLLKAVTEAGFESIDDAATQYYTSSFKEDSLCHWAQERSRRRSLITFLDNLHRSAEKWSEKDVQGYKSHIGAVAEKWYVDEFLNARRELMNSEMAVDHSGSGFQGREDTWHVDKESEINEIIRLKKILTKEKMPETWSLLFELTQKAYLQQPRGSQAVDAFLLLLLDDGGS